MGTKILETQTIAEANKPKLSKKPRPSPPISHLFESKKWSAWQGQLPVVAAGFSRRTRACCRGSVRAGTRGG
ncbi:hypothetical protein V6N12_068483 [Hibiscus sabdariffa]|uniref:Uncharacterized protein n=1 Tax=Hibiscus sabdariffa TaxID=183260 RepID=A0ABR2FQ96_9ROSI